MRWFRLAAPMLLWVGSALHAQSVPDIALAPGEAVTVRIDTAGPPERQPAQWTQFDLFVARQLAGETPPDAPVPEASPIYGGPRTDPIPQDRIRIRFHSIAGRHAMLVVENGSDLALTYRARMTGNGQTRHTDVCVVRPHLPSYEYWPHPLDRIALSDFRFVSWEEGRVPTCE